MSVSDRKEAARALAQARRIVVKVGSTLLVEQASGRLNRAWLETLAEDIALCASGDRTCDGFFGRDRAWTAASRLARGKLKLEEKQAAAAVGQIRLAHAWKEMLERHEIVVSRKSC